MLTVIKGLLEATAAKELVDALSGAPFVDGAATAQGATKTVKHSLQLPVEHALSQKLGRVILARLNTSDAFKAAAVPHTILPLRFCRYDVDMAYGTHLDLPIMGTPSGSIRTDLSMTVFLTDPNDYDGGVLVFESEYGTKSVRGAAGDAVIYPSSLLHRVEVARPKSVSGKTTTAALQSGLLYGFAGVVDSMVERIRGELGASARVIATGGLAHRVGSESRTIERVEPFLTLEGLRIIFEKNRPQPEGSRKESSE